MDSIETQFVSFPKMPRLHREIVITEKLDGTNAQIYISTKPEDDTGCVARVLVGTELLSLHAGSRNRWIIPGDDNFGFARWVADNAHELAQLGPGRHFGEWWGKGIQRGYGLSEKRFSLFNVTRWAHEVPRCCHVVPVLYTGVFGLAEAENAAARLRREGSVAAPGFMKPEGIVVFHTAANVAFKQTLEDDDVPKSKGQKTEPFNG